MFRYNFTLFCSAHCTIEAIIRYLLGAVQMDSDSLTAYFLGQAIWRSEHVVSGGWALAVHFLFAITTYESILLVRLRSKKSMAFAYSSSFGNYIPSLDHLTSSY